MKERQQGMAFITIGLIAMTADSPNTLAWAILSILTLGVICIVPMLCLPKPRNRMPRKLRRLCDIQGSSRCAKRRKA